RSSRNRMRTTIQEDAITGKASDLRLMRRLLGYFKPYGKQLALSFLLLILISVLQLAGPYLVKIAIDSYILKGDWAGLNLVVGAYLVVLLVTFALQYAQIYTMQLFGQGVMHDIRLSLFSHLQKMSLSFFNRNPIGRIVTRVVNDVETLSEMSTQGIVETAGDLIALASIIAALFLLNGKLALLTMLAISPILYLAKRYGDKTRDVYGNIRVSTARMNSFIQENVSGMSTVQMFNREEENFKRFDRINAENRDEQLKSLLYSAVYFPVVEVFAAGALGIIVWYGGGEAIKGAIQLGVLVASIQYIQRLFQPIRDLSEKYNIMQAAMASSERIFDVLDTPEEIPDPVLPVVLHTVRGEIEFEDVSFSYTAEGHALKGITFHLKPGESVAIVGATGAGKTSLINLIGRFYDIQHGRILLDGVDIRKMDKCFLRRQVGIVLQDAFLFAGDIEYNIRLGDEGIPPERVYEAARQVNADAFIEKLPKGYQEEVQERGGTLSLGQKQLISFARVLAYDPKIVILDEATSSVDTETEILIRNAFSKLIKGRTSIIIAHRLSTIKHVDKIMVIDKGEIAEMGSHEELLAKKGIYRDLHQLQFGR
ncbi:MAG TPA: ABC transporter ATP-binding protein, partial [Nitrospirota bacterium]|nr:ABC transporter ATP-binding protein [Nitrospirota bacterium]